MPEGAYKVLAEAQQLERRGKSVIHLEIGQPDFDTPDNIKKAAIEAIKLGHTKYTPPLGILPLRNEVAKFTSKSTSTNTNFTEVGITPSGKTALFTAMASVINPGDEVIYPDPGFPSYKTLIKFFGGVPIPLPLLESENFSFDTKHLKNIFTKQTKLIILNSPSNPTGGIIPKKDLQEIANLAIQYKSWVISDEIYSQIRFSTGPYESIYSIPKMKKQTIIINGFSKTYSMTGWRLGWVVAPKSIMDKVDSLLTHSIGCTASFTQEAGVKALKDSQATTRQMVAEFKKRRDFVVNSLNNIEGVTCLKPDGAFYVFPNIKHFKKSSSYIANYLLKKAGVALLDGTSFGEYGEGYLRISYATSIEKLRLGLDRIESSLRKLR